MTADRPSAAKRVGIIDKIGVTIQPTRTEEGRGLDLEKRG